jgi:hypothetical protein
MYQDHYYHKFVTVVKQNTSFLIQYWSLPELELQNEFFCANLMTCFARLVYFDYFSYLYLLFG